MAESKKLAAILAADVVGFSRLTEEADGDLMGDGVNIAARLEGVAQPEAICPSENAYRQVKGRLGLTVTDLGPTRLKNIAEPVRAYSVQVGPSSPAKPVAPADLPAEAKPLALPDRPSSAVLAFQTMGGDAEQEYFADGMVEDIITGLSRIKWLFVIARNSSFAYKGKRTALILLVSLSFASHRDTYASKTPAGQPVAQARP